MSHASTLNPSVDMKTFCPWFINNFCCMGDEHLLPVGTTPGHIFSTFLSQGYAIIFNQSNGSGRWLSHTELYLKSPFGHSHRSNCHNWSKPFQMGFSGTTQVCYGHLSEPFEWLKIIACPWDRMRRDWRVLKLQVFYIIYKWFLHVQ